VSGIEIVLVWVDSQDDGELIDCVLAQSIEHGILSIRVPPLCLSDTDLAKLILRALGKSQLPSAGRRWGCLGPWLVGHEIRNIYLVGGDYLPDDVFERLASLPADVTMFFLSLRMETGRPPSATRLALDDVALHNQTTTATPARQKAAARTLPKRHFLHFRSDVLRENSLEVSDFDALYATAMARSMDLVQTQDDHNIRRLAGLATTLAQELITTETDPESAYATLMGLQAGLFRCGYLSMGYGALMDSGAVNQLTPEKVAELCSEADWQRVAACLLTGLMGLESAKVASLTVEAISSDGSSLRAFGDSLPVPPALQPALRALRFVAETNGYGSLFINRQGRPADQAVVQRLISSTTERLGTEIQPRSQLIRLQLIDIANRPFDHWTAVETSQSPAISQPDAGSWEEVDSLTPVQELEALLVSVNAPLGAFDIGNALGWSLAMVDAHIADLEAACQDRGVQLERLPWQRFALAPRRPLPWRAGEIASRTASSWRGPTPEEARFIYRVYSGTCWDKGLAERPSEFQWRNLAAQGLIESTADLRLSAAVEYCLGARGPAFELEPWPPRRSYFPEG